jgi:hypothetical protein
MEVLSTRVLATTCIHPSGRESKPGLRRTDRRGYGSGTGAGYRKGRGQVLGGGGNRKSVCAERAGSYAAAARAAERRWAVSFNSFRSSFPLPMIGSDSTR